MIGKRIILFLTASVLLFFTSCASTGGAKGVDSPNLALMRDAESSSKESMDLRASLTLDGKMDTRWSSAFSDNEWMYVDLGQETSIKQIVIYWETAHAEQYKILVSNDTDDWSEVYFNEYNEGGENVVTLPEAVVARYVKILGITRATQWGYSILELEVYDHEFKDASIAAEPILTWKDGWELVWSDEFDGPEINTENWTHEIGRGDNGWGNNELEYYTDNPENSSIITDEEGNSVLMIEAKQDDSQEYTSARMITRGNQSFRYGKIEARIKLPYGQGIWPAFWMLGENFNEVGWPACGEIDILEMIGGEGNGHDNTIYGTIHYSDRFGQWKHTGKMKKLREGIMADEYHTITIEWYPDTIKWFLDDVMYQQEDISAEDRSEFQEEFFLLLNVAVGGNWPGYPDDTTEFPQRMLVDYIRVYKDTLE